MRLGFFFCLSLFLITACSNEPKQHLKAVGGKVYGGEFKFMSSEKVHSVFTLASVDVYSQRITAQIYESLLRLNPKTMEVEPSLAESYKVSSDAKSFTFKIRKGVKFHDDACFSGSAGRELTAEDVKYTLDMACSGLQLNKMSYLLVNRIKGAKEYFAKSKSSIPAGGVSGVKVLDASTVKIELEESFAGFPSIMTHTNLGIFPKEMIEYYKEDVVNHAVGTGAFILDSYDDSGVNLTRNPGYWRKDEFGNQLPFLDKVIMTYAKSKKSELLAFRNKEIDLVLQIPVDEIDNMIGSLADAQAGKNVKHKVESVPAFHMNFLSFACNSPEFKDPRVRQAFALAIDKVDLVDNHLKGEGWPAKKGVVPAMDTYDDAMVVGTTPNFEAAKKLLADAGYADGTFPKMDIYVNAKKGTSTHKLYVALVNQLKANLNVDLTIKLCTRQERDNAVTSGKAKIWRTGWIADYPDPESFFSLFYTGYIRTNSSEVNATRFSNPLFDQLYNQFLRESNPTKRNELYVACDQLLLKEVPAIPLCTDDFMVMVNAHVRDFQINPMEVLDFSSIFIKEPKK